MTATTQNSRISIFEDDMDIRESFEVCISRCQISPCIALDYLIRSADNVANMIIFMTWPDLRIGLAARTTIGIEETIFCISNREIIG